MKNDFFATVFTEPHKILLMVGFVLQLLQLMWYIKMSEARYTISYLLCRKTIPRSLFSDT